MQTYINNKNTVESDKIKNTKSSREQKLQKNQNLTVICLFYDHFRKTTYKFE